MNEIDLRPYQADLALTLLEADRAAGLDGSWHAIAVRLIGSRVMAQILMAAVEQGRAENVGAPLVTPSRDALAEALSWVSGEMTHWSEDAHPDHNRWSWRGDGHGPAMYEFFRSQADALLASGVVVTPDVYLAGLAELAEEHVEAYPEAGWCKGCHNAARREMWPCAVAAALTTNHPIRDALAAARIGEAERKVGMVRGLLAAYGEAKGTPADYEFLIYQIGEAVR